VPLRAHPRATRGISEAGRWSLRSTMPRRRMRGGAWGRVDAGRVRPASRPAAPLRSTLALAPREDPLAQPQRLRRHLEQLVVLHPLERPLDLERARRRQHGVLVLARGADVGELLRARPRTRFSGET